MAASEAVETKNIITGVLVSTPVRVTMKQLCDDFRNMVGYKIPICKLGFPSYEAYLRSIPDTVKIYGSGPSAEVGPVVKAKSAHINALVGKQRKDNLPVHKRQRLRNYQIPNRQPSNRRVVEDSRDVSLSKVPKNIQNNLRRVIMKFPEGLWCRFLSIEYQKIVRENLCFRKYNYRSMIEMCTDLPEIFHFVASGEDFMLYDRNKAIPSLNQNERAMQTQDSKPPGLDWSRASILVPADVLYLSEEISQYSLSDVHVGDYLDINIGEIYDLNDFWIFIRCEALDSHMKEFQRFFQAHRNRYLIPELFLEVGLYCTVSEKDEYHRCVITDLLPNDPDLVQVLFIDYGSIGQVHTKEIWYLPTKFSGMPCQAIKSKLSGVISIPGRPKESVEKFNQLLTNSELVAEITKIDKQKLILEIYLADITDPEHIFYINDKLVEGGYAEYC